MDSLKKVIWAEGIFLSQQHFQAWERHQDTQHAIRQRTASPFNWGVIDLDIDESLLRVGVFKLRKIKAIYPDGRLIGFKESGDGSLSSELSDQAGDSLDIYLGLPANNSASGISGYQSQGQLNAWCTQFVELADDHDPSRVREVMLANPNLQLLKNNDSQEHFVTIKVARVVRVSEKEFMLDQNFIPPVISLSANKQLNKMLSDTTQLISARVSQLVETASQVSNLFEYNQQDIVRLIRSQALNHCLRKLKHLVRYPESHPLSYYDALVDIISQLSPIEKPEAILAISEYHHTQLFSILTQLNESLRDLLKEVVRASSERVQLIKEFEGLFKASGLSSTKLSNENFYLAVYHESPDPSWVTEFSTQAKVGASEHIEMIVSSALGGVRLVHTQRTPNSLSVKSGYEYFRLENVGDFWQKIIDTESLSLFLPYAFQNANVELVSVEE